MLSEELIAFGRPVLPCRLSITDPDCSNLLNLFVYFHITKFLILTILFCNDLWTMTGE